MRIKSYLAQNVILCVLGGGMYYCIEVMYRGYSHWTMFLLGGLCFGWVDLICEKFTRLKSLWQKMLVSALGITLMEWFTGCIVNLWLKWNVWDYSALPMQIMGQVSLLFSLFWFLLSYPAIRFCESIRVLFFE